MWFVYIPTTERALLPVSALLAPDLDSSIYALTFQPSPPQGKITKPRDFKGLRKRSFFEMTFVEA